MDRLIEITGEESIEEINDKLNETLANKTKEFVELVQRLEKKLDKFVSGIEKLAAVLMADQNKKPYENPYEKQPWKYPNGDVTWTTKDVAGQDAGLKFNTGQMELNLSEPRAYAEAREQEEEKEKRTGF